MKENIWQLQDAKSKFSEVVESAITEGPQFVTKRGKKAVVVVSIEEYEKSKRPKYDLISFFEDAPRIELEGEREE
ncbi:MAG: type II toxin-antitoxin system Phd/YefM family antitoxin [Leptospiraceae bacterium]|nr:type II toxin-antitoxin system Phd/YefM family antitoxin [Leptospiraceae bacterium]